MLQKNQIIRQLKSKRGLLRSATKAGFTLKKSLFVALFKKN